MKNIYTTNSPSVIATYYWTELIKFVFFVMFNLVLLLILYNSVYDCVSLLSLFLHLIYVKWPLQHIFPFGTNQLLTKNDQIHT